MRIVPRRQCGCRATRSVATLRALLRARGVDTYHCVTCDVVNCSWMPVGWVECRGCWGSICSDCVASATDRPGPKIASPGTGSSPPVGYVCSKECLALAREIDAEI